MNHEKTSKTNMFSLQKFTQKRLDELASGAQNKYHTIMRPIYGADKKSEPYHIGSCLLIQIGSAHFIATAAHIVDIAEKTTLYLGGLKKLIELNGTFYKSGDDRKNDKFDCAIMKLSEDDLDKIDNLNFLTSDDLDPNDLLDENNLYFAFGYPTSQNKKKNLKDKKIKPYPLSFTGQMAKDYSYKNVRADKNIHLLISFHKQKTKDEGGKKMIAPDPYGFSGGGVWRLANWKEFAGINQPKFKLVGILTQWDSENAVLMATRISFLVEIIKYTYPELNCFLPEIKGVKIRMVD